MVFSSAYSKILSVAPRNLSLSCLSVHSKHSRLHLRTNLVNCYRRPLKTKPQLVLPRSKRMSAESILDLESSALYTQFALESPAFTVVNSVHIEIHECNPGTLLLFES